MNTFEILQAYHLSLFEFSSRYINIGIQKAISVIEILKSNHLKVGPFHFLLHAYLYIKQVFKGTFFRFKNYYYIQTNLYSLQIYYAYFKNPNAEYFFKIITCNHIDSMS